jgi:hypothetical protein
MPFIIFLFVFFFNMLHSGEHTHQYLQLYSGPVEEWHKNQNFYVGVLFGNTIHMIGTACTYQKIGTDHQFLHFCMHEQSSIKRLHKKTLFFLYSGCYCTIKGHSICKCSPLGEASLLVREEIIFDKNLHPIRKKTFGDYRNERIANFTVRYTGWMTPYRRSAIKTFLGPCVIGFLIDIRIPHPLYPVLGVLYGFAALVKYIVGYCELAEHYKKDNPRSGGELIAGAFMISGMYSGMFTAQYVRNRIFS